MGRVPKDKGVIPDGFIRVTPFFVFNITRRQVNMMRIEVSRYKTGVSLLLVVSGIAPASADTLSDMLQGGKLNLQLRPRFESVQQDGKPNNADAFTMRTLLGYSLKPAAGFGGTLQFINVSNLGSAHYNNTRNGLTAYPVVADPAVNDVNQAFLSYAGLPDTALKFGRQIIVLDNSRFVGNVDFRQNMQTFDGFSVENRSLPETVLFASHISHTNGSYANFQSPVGYNLQPVSIDLIHVAFKPTTGTTLAAYDYLYKDRSLPDYAATNISDATAGLRLDGTANAGDSVKLSYTAEYARQRGYGGGKSGIDAKYLHLGGGASMNGIRARLDYEVLGSNGTGTYGLQTPLATKHAFNGWADMFLATPGKGLRDMYATVGGALAKTKLMAVYHDYKADHDSTHYGTEWDLSAVYPIDKHLSFSLIYADYAAKDGAGSNFPGTAAPNVNTRKSWAMMNYTY